MADPKPKSEPLEAKLDSEPSPEPQAMSRESRRGGEKSQGRDEKTRGGGKGKGKKKQQSLARGLAKQGLLGSSVTFVMCCDQRVGKCASPKKMRNSWKTLKQGIKLRRKAGGTRASAIKTQCLGVCRHGPIVGVLPEGRWYGKCNQARVEEVLDHHLGDGPQPSCPQVAVEEKRKRRGREA